MKGGDGEANYAYYALHKLKILPSTLVKMTRKEKAFIYASIDLYVEEEKKNMKKVKGKRN
ncbi:hypothetical protein FDB54_11710 [Clostridium botulinum]|nr:hypothetical protein [Clostridium botulinum]